MCVWVVALLPQRLKSTFFKIFSSLQVHFGDLPLEKFQKMLILVFQVIVQLPKVFLGGCTFTSKTKTNVFLNFFFTPGLLWGPSTAFHSKKFQKTMILAFEANSKLSSNYTFPHVLALCM